MLLRKQVDCSVKLFDRPLKHRRLGVFLELTKQIIYIKKEKKPNLKFLVCVVYFMVHPSGDVVIVVILIQVMECNIFGKFLFPLSSEANVYIKNRAKENQSYFFLSTNCSPLFMLVSLRVQFIVSLVERIDCIDMAHKDLLTRTTDPIWTHTDMILETSVEGSRHLSKNCSDSFPLTKYLQVHPVGVTAEMLFWLFEKVPILQCFN